MGGARGPHRGSEYRRKSPTGCTTVRYTWDSERLTIACGSALVATTSGRTGPGQVMIWTTTDGPSGRIVTVSK